MSFKIRIELFKELEIINHNFQSKPFFITAEAIKSITKKFKETGSREPRILCKQDNRNSRPQVFIDNKLFILPTKNGEYAILSGE